MSLFREVEREFGFRIEDFTSVSGGWLNKKWKLDTDHGEFLLKSFSSKRYNSQKLVDVERALQWQLELFNKGVACPKPLVKNNRIIQNGKNDSYMVMSFCSGENKLVNSIQKHEMYRLGQACGKMHLEMQTISTDDLIFDGQQIYMDLMDYRKNRIVDVSTKRINKAIIDQQDTIFEYVSPEFFDEQIRGIAHQDFASDNLLFDSNGATILDFDRSRFSYPHQDIGRAILSFSLTDNGIQTELVKAFLKGYREFLPFTKADLIRALHLSWCIETPWWIQFNTLEKENSEKISRFQTELIWLTENWFVLERCLEEVI